MYICNLQYTSCNLRRSSNKPCLVDIAHRDGGELDLRGVTDVRAGDDLVLEELVEHVPYPVDGSPGQAREHRQPQDDANPRLALKLH